MLLARCFNERPFDRASIVLSAEAIDDAKPCTAHRTAGDHSASIGLPAGWQLTQVVAVRSARRSDGEAVFLGMLYQGIRDPGQHAAGLHGGGPGLVASFNGDLFTAIINNEPDAPGPWIKLAIQSSLVRATS